MATWFQRMDERFTRGVGRWGDAGKAYFTSGFHKRGMKTAREWWGLDGFDKKLWARYPSGQYQHSLFTRMGGVGRTLGLGFMAWDAYSGYKEEGVWGAAKGLARGFAENYAMGALGIPLLKAAAVGALIGGVAYGVASAAGIRGTGGAGIFKSNVERWRAEHRSINLGTPVLDPYGTGSTMRQRSLQAIQESRINGMNALGNEASLMYRPYFS
jgi:hypothetical protein